MKNLHKAILVALGMSLPMSVIASPGDDVTIRMMHADEHAGEAVTRHIELPESANDRAREHSAKGLETANNDRNGEHDNAERENDHEMDHERERDTDHEDRDQDMDRDREREREMERENEHEREREIERDDRKDVEHGGRDREEIERDNRDNIDHDSDSRQDVERSEIERPEIEQPEAPDAPEHSGGSDSLDRN